MKTPSLSSAMSRCFALALLGLGLMGAGCSAYRPDPGSIPDFPDERRAPPAPVAVVSGEMAQLG